MSFDWQTEENFSWDDEPVVETREPKRPGRWRPWAFLLVVFIALGGTGWVILRQLGDRVEEVSVGVEDDVLASHNLVRLAADQQDAELLTTVLSGRDPLWSRTQEQLVSDGLLFDYPALGLETLPEGSEVISVTLAPDLASAEVLSFESYVVQVGNGVSETVLFERHAIYRLGEASWLYAPPESNAAYWGGWVEISGAALSLTVSERDAEVGRRLSRDLALKITEMCFGLQGVVCPAGYHVDVTLEREPESIRLNYYDDILDYDGSAISLPTPSLIGVPTDEASYEALFRGYAAYVLGMVLTDLSGWECCEQGLLYQALLSKQLEQLAVQPWPLAQTDYGVLYNESALLERQFAIWNEPRLAEEGEDNRAALAVVAYLSNLNPGRDVATMVRALSAEDSFWDWVLLYVGDAADTAVLERDWQQFVYNRSRPVAGPPPYALPKQEALLLCSTALQVQSELYSYDVRNGVLVQERLGEQFVTLFQLAEGGEALLMQAQDGLSAVQLFRWQGGEMEPFWTPVADSYLITIDYDPDTNVLAVLMQDSANNRQFYSFDLSLCPEGLCEPVSVAGWPIYSPDKSHILLIDDPVTTPEGAQQLSVLNPAGETVLSANNIADPVWLDAQTLIYVSHTDPDNPALVTQAITAPDEITTLTRVSELASLIIEADENEVYQPVQMLYHPARADRAFMTIRATNESELMYTFALNLNSLQAEIVAQSSILPNLNLSPDGSYLLSALGENNLVSTGRLNVYDIEQKTSQELPRSFWIYNLVWTSDGRWLLKVDGNVLTLLTPDQSYEQTLIHDFICFPAGWVDK